MNKTIIIIVAIILIAGAFYGGIKYNQTQVASAQSARFAAFGGGTGGTGGRRGMMGGGVASGEIIAKDATSVTIKLRDGSTKIVLVSPSTTISKSTSGSAADLTIGKQISAIGTANSDGSITSQSIQLRPATTTLNQ